MFALLASIVTGHDADIWLLIAVILFAICCVMSVGDKAWAIALLAAGLTFGFVGFLVT